MVISVFVVGLLAALDGASPDAGLAPPAEGAPTVTIRGAAEAELALLPSGFGENGADFFLTVRPVAGFGVSDVFSIELGPTFRLRVIDSPPDNRSSDYGGVLRRADWDQLSDFGQILQSLKIGADSGPFTVRAGPIFKKTLGLGHLLSRYSNQENLDYHPAAGDAVLSVGPIRAEFFASDILGGRIFAGDLGWDLGRTFSGNPELQDRFILALELAHDFARAGLAFRPDPAQSRVELPQVTLLQLDASAVVVRTKSIRVLVEGGVGSRSNDEADVGFVGGGAMDANVGDIGFSLKLELRKQSGGYRQGFFGPTYELSRFADYGFSGPAIGASSLPNTWSDYGELRFGVGTLVSFDFAAEHFFFGRTDLDATLDVVLLKSWLLGQARFSLVGLGVEPRASLSASLKLRLFASFYLLGAGGTVFVPQPDGTLLRSFTASAGVGVDFER